MDLAVWKFLVASIIPLLIYKHRTRNEIILKEKSPFIIDLYVTLDRLHIKLRKFGDVDTGKTAEQKNDELLDGLADLMKNLNDNYAKARLFLHSSTNDILERYLDDCRMIVMEEVSDNMSVHVNKMKDTFYNHITPSLSLELNGWWEYYKLRINRPVP